jgi:hypothetical protein
MVRYVRCEVISPTINLILVILIRPPETSVSKASRQPVAKQVKYGWEMAAELCRRSIYRARGVFLHAVNLRHETDGFTSPPKKGVLRILSPLKSIVLSRVWTRKLWVQWQAHKPLDHRSPVYTTLKLWGRGTGCCVYVCTKFLTLYSVKTLVHVP